MLARHPRNIIQGGVLRRLGVGITILLLAAIPALASGALPAAVGRQTLPVTLDAVLDHALHSSPVAQLSRIQRSLGQEQAAEMQAPLRPYLGLEANATQLEQTQFLDPFCFTLDRSDWDWNWNGNEWEIPEGEICIPPERTQFDLKAKSTSATISLRGAVFPTALVTATRSLADLSERSAQAEYDQAAEELALQVIDLYYGILQAESGVNLLTLALQEAELRLAETEWQEQAGSATPTDRLEAKARVLQIHGELIGAQGTVTSLRIRLNQLAGYPLGTELVLARPQDKPAVIPTVDRALRLAGTKRPDLQQAQLAIEQALAHQTIVRAQEGPTLQLFGTMQRADMEYTIGLDRHGFGQLSVKGTRQHLEEESVESSSEGWAVGINGSWALLDGGSKQAKLAQASLRVEAATLHLELLHSGLEADLRRYEAELFAAKNALDASRQAYEAMVEAALRVAEMYTRGAVTKTELLQIQLGAMHADQAMLEAERAYAKARMNYMRTAGLLFEDWF